MRKLDSEFLLTADVARVLGVVPDAVRALARKGALPYTRTAGGVKLFRREDVEALQRERVARRGVRRLAR